MLANAHGAIGIDAPGKLVPELARIGFIGEVDFFAHPIRSAP